MHARMSGQPGSPPVREALGVRGQGGRGRGAAWSRTDVVRGEDDPLAGELADRWSWALRVAPTNPVHIMSTCPPRVGQPRLDAD